MATIFYAYRLKDTIKDEVLKYDENTVRLIVLSLILLLSSSIFDILSDLGFGSGVFDIAHDLTLSMFILLMLFGFRRLEREISDFLKCRTPRQV